MSDNSCSWYVEKENIQPLATGRSLSKLETTSSDLILIRNSYEEKILLDESEDPLANWVSFIDFIEQSYGDASADGRLSEVINDCVRRFIEDPKYSNDARFLDIVLKYIRSCNNPLEIYNSLFAKRVFSGLAKFYVEWAWDIEVAGNFKEADNILHKGMMCEAEPSHDLSIAQLQLQGRLAKRIVANEMGDVSSESTCQRKALVGLRPKLKKGVTNAPIDRAANIRTDFQGLSAPVGASSSGIKIYVDENNPIEPIPSGSIKASVVPHDKENVVGPSKWNGVKVKSKPVVTRQCDFVIFEEDDEELDVQMDNMVDTDVLKVRKKRADSPPMFQLESSETNQKFYCDLHALYIGGSEYSFEEIRYKKWLKSKKNESATENEKTQSQEEKLVPVQTFIIYEDPSD